MTIRSADEIYRDYEAEVMATFPRLEVWWNSLSHRTLEGTERKDRWPMGPVSHPRFIEIFRRYFVEILERNQRIEDGLEEESATEPLPDESLWGRENPLEESSPDLIRPQSLLIDQLAARHPELTPRIKYFVFIPIGSDDEPEPRQEGASNGSA